MRTDEEIYNQIDKASEMDGTYSGMSYEQGVQDALRWVVGDENEPPLTD